jgi:hypothetical protein
MTVRLTLALLLVALAGGVPIASALPGGFAPPANVDADGRLLPDRPDGAAPAELGRIAEHPDGYAGVASDLPRGVLIAPAAGDGVAWAELGLGIGIGAALGLVLVGGLVAARVRGPVRA